MGDGGRYGHGVVWTSSEAKPDEPSTDEVSVRVYGVVGFMVELSEFSQVECFRRRELTCMHVQRHGITDVWVHRSWRPRRASSSMTLAKTWLVRYHRVHVRLTGNSSFVSPCDGLTFGTDWRWIRYLSTAKRFSWGCEKLGLSSEKGIRLEQESAWRKGVLRCGERRAAVPSESALKHCVVVWQAMACSRETPVAVGVWATSAALCDHVLSQVPHGWYFVH